MVYYCIRFPAYIVMGAYRFMYRGTKSSHHILGSSLKTTVGTVGKKDGARQQVVKTGTQATVVWDMNI